MNLRLLVILIFFVSLPFASADSLVVNSKDWRDVYLGLHYGNLNEYDQIYFVQGFSDSEVVSKLIAEDKKNEVLIIESTKDNFIKDYGKFLKLKGFDNVKTIESSNPLTLQLKLADTIGSEKFIVVRDDFGFDAVSVASYAYAHNCSVLFVNDDNADSIKSFLEQRSDWTLLYGDLGRRVLSKLSDLNADIINTGSKFDDNKQIVSRLMDERKPKLVLLTDSRYIENEIMRGKHGDTPVLFFSNAKDTVDFLSDKDISLVQITGASSQAGTMIREESGRRIGVLAKYAMSYRGIPDLEGLRAIRLFEVPTPFVRLSVDSVDYDEERGLLLVKYTNLGNDEAFFTSRINLVSKSFGDIGEVVDDHVHSLKPGESFLVPYEVNTSLSPVEDFDAHVFCLYGEAIGSMNQYVTNQGKTLPPFRMPIAEVRILDDSSVEVESVDFAVADYMFLVSVRNTGDKTVFVDAEIFDFMVNERSNTFSFDNSPGFEGAKKILPGETGVLHIDAELLEKDFEQNQTINLVVYHGEDKHWMINQESKKVPVHLNFEKVIMTGLSSFVSSWWWLMLGFFLFVLFVVWRKKRKEEEKQIQTVSKEKSRQLTDFLGKKD